ncbi:MAG: hypothetical protein IT548_07210 [Alphaproteobacteria bacterium]|nr:hypothetical protein [Alphaproteobacteria bacterium]
MLAPISAIQGSRFVRPLGSQPPAVSLPISNILELKTESDVEQKFIMPFLAHPSFMNIPASWIRTKDYMIPTEIDKIAGKRSGYIPDYSIWYSGIPVVIIEAKSPEYRIEVGLREAQLYALQINKRYPPNVSPIKFVVSCNGEQIAVAAWDSEVEILKFNCAEIQPGTAILAALTNVLGKDAVEEQARALNAHLARRPFFSVQAFLGAKRNIQLGPNSFGDKLLPSLTRFFGNDSDTTPDEVIDRAYVSSDEITGYDAVLETFLRDTSTQHLGIPLKVIQTSKNKASGITEELSKFSQNPKYFSRVQLIVGAVGSGKSTFIRRYYRRLMTADAERKTRWAFINFNDMAGLDGLPEWISKEFIRTFGEMNGIDVYGHDEANRILAVELNRYDRGPAKALKTIAPVDFQKGRVAEAQKVMSEPIEYAQAIARHFGGELGLGIVVVFDNVDRRSRDEQLAIFGAAQWFKGTTRGLVLMNLRDSTFEAHRDEPPLDAFTNAVNFYIRPPRLWQVVRKRLELLMENLADAGDKYNEFSASSYKIRYPASALGEYLMGIYGALFGRTSPVGAKLEAFVAKDVRSALAMFTNIILSPHIPTTQIASVMMSPENRIDEDRIIRALMRGRYLYYNGNSVYCRNILSPSEQDNRQSNFLYMDLLEFLVRRRKEKIDFSQEGYATVATLVARMGQLGYDDEDALRAINTLATWGLLEPESLVADELRSGDAVKAHASAWVHTRFFVSRVEYLVGCSAALRVSSRELAEDLAQRWSQLPANAEFYAHAKIRLLERLRDYFTAEYERRCRRHAFYREAGYGGRTILAAFESALDHLKGGRKSPFIRKVR